MESYKSYSNLGLSCCPDRPSIRSAAGEGVDAGSEAKKELAESHPLECCGCDEPAPDSPSSRQNKKPKGKKKPLRPD